MAKTSSGDENETARRQREHAKQMEAVREQRDPLEAGLHVSTMLTTKEHVGKIPEEPHKSDEMSALGTDVKDRTGVDRVTTAPRKTPGKGTTDEVVTSPPTHAALGHTAPAPTEADKVRDAARGKVKVPDRTPPGTPKPKKAAAPKRKR
jgi:hypothetical protein